MMAMRSFAIKTKGSALSNPNFFKMSRGRETPGYALLNPFVVGRRNPRSSLGGETPRETPRETSGIDFECKCGQSIDKVCTHIFWLNSRRPYCLQKPWKEGDK